MERPTYENELINTQNDRYAGEIIERFANRPKNADNCMNAIIDSFIMGAGGHEGSFDAAMVLEYGGLTILFESLGVEVIEVDEEGNISEETFAEVVRASMDFGAAYDTLEEEITDEVREEHMRCSELFGPLTSRFNLLDATPWQSPL